MLEKLLSGAQTGADRAALDWAIFRDIPHGGYFTSPLREDAKCLDPYLQNLQITTTLDGFCSLETY
jgi:hypothetical protein